MNARFVARKKNNNCPRGNCFVAGRRYYAVGDVRSPRPFLCASIFELKSFFSSPVNPQFVVGRMVDSEFPSASLFNEFAGSRIGAKRFLNVGFVLLFIYRMRRFQSIWIDFWCKRSFKGLELELWNFKTD